jgi:hypothetical protein
MCHNLLVARHSGLWSKESGRDDLGPNLPSSRVPELQLFTYTGCLVVHCLHLLFGVPFPVLGPTLSLASGPSGEELCGLLSPTVPCPAGLAPVWRSWVRTI